MSVGSFRIVRNVAARQARWLRKWLVIDRIVSFASVLPRGWPPSPGPSAVSVPQPRSREQKSTDAMLGERVWPGAPTVRILRNGTPSARCSRSPRSALPSR